MSRTTNGGMGMYRSIIGPVVSVVMIASAWAAPPPPPGDAWTSYTNLAPVTGVDGNVHAASCSALPGTDPTFSFWAKKGTAKDVVVYFDGGGACWDDLTCSFPHAPGLPPNVPQFYAAVVPPSLNPAAMNGIFSLANPANPVKDWNFVYIPYCTGDLHLGSGSKQYANAGNPALPPVFTIEHRGFDNFMVVLDWIKKTFAAPKRILVAGSSAGGYGASASFVWVQESYPNAHVYVIADASQGVTTATWDTSNPGRNSWSPHLAPWVYGNPFTGPSFDLLSLSANAYPHVKVAQFTTNGDATQIGFYSVMKRFYGPGGSCPDPAADWNQQMLGALDLYTSEVDNFRYYVAGATYHTILDSPNFYTESSGGIVYSRWVDAMLQSQGGTNGTGGGAWDNSACPTCLSPVPCQ